MKNSSHPLMGIRISKIKSALLYIRQFVYIYIYTDITAVEYKKYVPKYDKYVRSVPVTVQRETKRFWPS